jgi:hypothetical protein
MTDILIPLMHDGSKYNNLELRYCLRSIEKHLKDYGNIFIVGELPEWIQKETVIHIPFEDSIDNKQRAWNIYRKIIEGITFSLQSIKLEGYFMDVKEEKIMLSDNFLFVNDDHYLLTDYIAGEFPYYHRGEIELGRAPNEPQRIQMDNTIEALKKSAQYSGISKQTEPKDFDVHCPIIYNKRIFKNLFSRIRNEWPEYGYGIKSFYCNEGNETGEQMEDLKFTQPAMKETIYRCLQDRCWFSIGDKCLTSGAMKEVLQELYGKSSIYEK